MANEEEKEEPEPMVVEFRVSMHCNACERTVAKVIAKFKGVETFTTEMANHKVVVTGHFDQKKLLKKLKKKTRKRVEIVEKEEEKEDPKDEHGEEEDALPPEVVLQFAWPPLLGYCKHDEAFMVFSDENPNACSIM
ncbi:hypothetical protein Tsubulata_040082 [Turnera subulata]|uniref:HMA domain-containing protein n=1 Tax=Turnera subulata TaxID=218843 RepID=A0A9Q0J443_9ROSI|nr:hypothetical protein Tsubulata_040082 [Turnera subulata]